MRDEERIARALDVRLRSALPAEVRLHGKGVHWRVDVAHGPRTCQINCFWYGPVAGLMLGMNPANARVANRPQYAVRTGPEYLVAFYDAERRHAGGRAHDEASVVASVRAWCEGRTIDELALAWPYVDRTRRRLRALLAPIEHACGDVARCVIEQTGLYELWIYGAGRSCRVHVGDDSRVGLSLLLGPAQVAFGFADDAPAIVARWMRGATLGQLANAGITVEPHAELLERGEAAAWHWHHFRARIADPSDVLAELRPLLERLAERPLVTSFFTYSSLNRLCFSASSHFPWVDDGLPVVSPSRHGDIYVDDERRSIDGAVERIEAVLAAYPVTPFFGSAVNLEIAPLDAELAAQGSAQRAALVQRNQWFHVEVTRGPRRCEVSARRLIFRDDSDEHVEAMPGKLPEAVAAIRRWLEEGCAMTELGQVKRDRFEPD